MNVAFLIYRRPELTARVFAEIARARPERLLVVADGPKSEAERAKCEATRRVTENVDWPCEVLRNYSDVNLGCKRRVSSGLDWVFSQVEEAIILEDDCLPHSDFFRFCVEMLERYRTDVRIGHIAGTNFDGGDDAKDNTYYFSRHPSIWGWATWRRAWQYYDVAIEEWPELRRNGWDRKVCPSAGEARAFRKQWDSVCSGELDTWDVQWEFACRLHMLITVRAGVNLVSNLGFGVEAGATHTTSASWVGGLSVQGLRFPLVHPSALEINRRSDERIARLLINEPSPFRKQLVTTVLNRHWYGRLFRKLPLIGHGWALWRGSMGKVSEKTDVRREKV